MSLWAINHFFCFRYRHIFTFSSILFFEMTPCQKGRNRADSVCSLERLRGIYSNVLQSPRLCRLTFTSTVDDCCWQCCLDRKLDLQISDIFSGDSAAKINIWQRLVAPCFSVQRLHPHQRLMVVGADGDDIVGPSSNV